MTAPWETNVAQTPEKAAPWEYATEPTKMESTVSWFKGDKRDPEIPLSYQSGLQLDAGDAAKMTALLATTASDDRLKSGIKKIMPDAQFETDQHGNLVVVAPVTGSADTSKQWTRFYPNPQGLDTTDIMQGAGAVALGEVIAPVAGLLGLGPAATAMGVGATEAGLVEKASSTLSEQPFKFADIPWGAAGGMLGVKAGQGLSRVFGGKPSVQMFDQAGNLTEDGQAFVDATGLDPSSITAEMAANIEKAVQRGAQPEQAAALAEAQTLPRPVPLTRGQVTGEKGQQLFEEAALKGSLGEGPERMLGGMYRTQQEALQENIPAIQQYLAGQQPAIARGQGAAGAQEALSGMRAASSQQARAAYEAARAAGTAGFATPEAAAEASDRLLTAVRAFPAGSRPGTNQILSQIDETLAGGGDVRTLFDLRAQLNNVAQAGTPDQTAASTVKRELDNVLIDALNNNLLRGNEDVVSLWRDAISKYADFKQTWDTNGVLKGLTETVTRDGDTVLKVAPEDAARYLFGVSSNSMVSKANLSRDLATLQKTLPEQDWNSLRQEAFLLLMDQAAKRSDEVSGSTLFSAWGKLKRENPPVVNSLFNEKEQALINQYVAVAQRISGRAQNFSNSAATAASILRNLFDSIGKTRGAQSAAQLWVLNKFVDMSRTGRTAAAVTGGTTPQAAQTLSGIAGAGAGGAAITAGEPSGAIEEQLGRTLPGINLR